MNDPIPSGAADTTSAPLRPIPREGLTRPAGIILSVLLTLALALCGLALGARGMDSPPVRSVTEYVSLAVSILLLIHLWQVCRTARGIVPLIAVASFLLYGLTGSFLQAGLVTAPVFAVFGGSLLVALLPTERLNLLPLIPIAAYLIAAAVSRDLVGAVAVLVPVPAAVTLALGTRQSARDRDGITRVGVICATSLALGLAFAAVIALEVFRRFGSLSPATLLSALDELREAYVTEITSVRLPEGATEEMKLLTTHEGATNIVNSVINLLPAIAVVTVLILSTVAQLILHAALVTFGHKESLTDRVRAYRISLIAGVVFVITYFMSLAAASGSSTLASTVAENISVILLPGLALAGLIRLIGGLTRKGARGMGCTFYLILLAPCLLFFAPPVLAFVEVIGHIRALILSRIQPPDED